MRLADFCRIVPGRHIQERDHNRTGHGTPYLTGPSDFGQQKAIATRWTQKPDALCAPGDILVTVKGAGVGKINYAPDAPSCIGRQLMAVRVSPDMADTDYAFLALTWAADLLKKEAMGATVPGLSIRHLEDLQIPLVPLSSQRRIAVQLKAQLAEVDRARSALQAQIAAADAIVAATLRESLSHGGTVVSRIGDCLDEVTQGIGPTWRQYPVLGATRAGLAPAKESVGKAPERYKPVRHGTIFYNPMRILLGSIAVVDEGDAHGITSPDYVVMTAKDGVLHPRWFYEWFRSDDGAAFVRSLTRGAVRERLLFKRLAPAGIHLPPWPVQVRTAEVMLAATAVRRQALSRLDTLDRLPAALLRQVFEGADAKGLGCADKRPCAP